MRPHARAGVEACPAAGPHLCARREAGAWRQPWIRAPRGESRGRRGRPRVDGPAGRAAGRCGRTRVRSRAVV